MANAMDKMPTQIGTNAYTLWTIVEPCLESNNDWARATINLSVARFRQRNLPPQLHQ